jgi:hypothetical protein
MKTQRKMFTILVIFTAMILLAMTAVSIIPAQAMGLKPPIQAMGINAPLQVDTPVAGITSAALFTWLLGSGGLILVLSWLVEHWAWYQKQSSDLKKIVFVAGVVVLGSAVHALQLYVPAAAWAQIDPWFQFVSGLVVLGAGAMGLHALTKPDTSPTIPPTPPAA